MTPITRFIFGFVAVNALVGAISLMFFPDRTGDLFFWTIMPPINAALFGALYLGGAVTVAWVAYRGLWEPARFLVPVLVSAGILISITTLLHMDRFTPGIKLAYWLIIYVGAPLLAVFIYYDQQRRGGNWVVTQPVAPLTHRIALVTGTFILIAGLFLLISPTTAVPYWPWPSSPLMIRVFASWFSAFGVGLLWFLKERDWGRVRNIANLMIAASVLDLLMIFLHRGDLTTTGLYLWIYCGHLIAFGVVGLVMHLLQRRYSGSSTLTS
jgi:hypothetical protein